MSQLHFSAATILYVDDEDIACKYFSRFFEVEYTVLTASNAEDALKILRGGEYRIDVVLTDFRMPHIDGGQLLRMIELEFPTIVRILVTAYADKDLLLATVNSGEIFRILEKPLDIDDVKYALRKAVELSRLRHERRLRFLAIDETLAFLAHELNTPLAAISNFAGGIRRRTAKGEATADQQREIERVALDMQNNARYCMTVLSSFVESVRNVGTSALDPAETTAAQLIESLLDTYPLSAAQRACIEVTVVEDFPVLTVPNCVSLVLSSILANGLRALRDTPEPHLTFLVCNETRPTIELLDNGPGIPAEVKQHLLLDPVTTYAEAGGSGWGMLFCKRIMQSFGGGIHIQSEAGKSTCVRLDFPKFKKPAKGGDR
ncbi:MAG TPA: hybrid sensor histidine kinase/response regulator [Burkholderiaceae bacterium]